MERSTMNAGPIDDLSTCSSATPSTPITPTRTSFAFDADERKLVSMPGNSLNIFTPPYTPSVSATLLMTMEHMLSQDPFRDLRCMYCYEHRNCLGGVESTCFKSPLHFEALPGGARDFHTACLADVAEVEKIIDAFFAYLTKLDKHKPYSAKTMSHENEAAHEAISQLRVVKRRIGELVDLAAILESEGFAAVPVEILKEMNRCRDWTEFLWGKMVKNHECLKLNFSLTFQGVY